jgi:hypothetical protein
MTNKGTGNGKSNNECNNKQMQPQIPSLRYGMTNHKGRQWQEQLQQQIPAG